MLSITLHELGHAFRLMRYKISIKEISLLGFGPKLVRFKFRRLFGQTLLTIRLIPLGAFVKPRDQEELERLTYKQKIDYLSGGILMNFLSGGIVYGVGALWNGAFTEREMIATFIPIALGLFGRFTRYLIVPIGILLLGLLISIITTKGLHEFNEGCGSLLSIAASIKQQIVWDKTLKITGLYMMSLGIFNCLPLSILDGGQIVMETIKLFFKNNERKIISADIYMIITTLPLLYLTYYALKSDVTHYILG